MNKSITTVVRTAAFLASRVISILAFGLLSAWAWDHLTPEQQEAIATVNTPWFVRARDRTLVSIDPGVVVGDKRPEDAYRSPSRGEVQKGPQARALDGREREVLWSR
jgi:hypothetical protein